MTQNTIETILEDPELVKRLDLIEQTSADSPNAYASRQSAVEFCRMMWRLVIQEGTNPFKEINLLENIVAHPGFKKLFREDCLQVKIIDLGGGNGDKAKLLIDNIPAQIITYLDIDISPYMSAIALKNLERLVDSGVRIVQLGYIDSVNEVLQTVLSLSEEEKQSIARKEFEKALSIHQSLEEIYLMNERIDLPLYCARNIASILEQKADKKSKSQLKKLVKCEEKMQSIFKDAINGKLFTPEEIDRYEKLCDILSEFCYNILESQRINHFSQKPFNPEEFQRFRRYFMCKYFVNTINNLAEACKEYLRQTTYIVNEQDPNKYNNFITLCLERRTLSNYLVAYFNRLKEVLKQGDFETFAKMHPYEHTKAVWTNLMFFGLESSTLKALNYDNRWEFETVSIDKNRHKIGVIVGVSKLEDEESDFGLRRLEREILSTFGEDTVAIADRSKSSNEKSLNTSTKGLTLDFMDFETVSKVLGLLSNDNEQKFYLLLGQTLGNYSKEERTLLIQNFYKQMRQGDFFLVGVDMAPECKTQEARELRLKQMKNEYCKGEDFVRTAINSRTANINVEYDESANDVVIHVENDGQRKEFLRSHK